MKAVKYCGVGHLEYVDMDKPTAGVGEVLVKIEYCGMCGTDIHAYKTPGIFDWELILGHEAVGTVEKVGVGVTNVKVGDRVAVGPPGDCGNCYSCNTGHPNTCAHAFSETLGIGPGTQGAYAEYVLSKHPQNELFPIPDKMQWEQAVLFDVMGVGFHAVRQSRLSLGDDVVVSGCGSIGLSIIQSAKLAGAKTLIAFDVEESRRKSALQAGADYALNPMSKEDMEQAGKLLAHAGGAQVSFEAAGNPVSIQQCIDRTMANGQIILVGNDGRPFELVTAALGPMEYDLKFSFTYTKEEIHMLFEMISSGKFKTDMFSVEKKPLAEAIDTMEKLAKGEIDVARVLLKP